MSFCSVGGGFKDVFVLKREIHINSNPVVFEVDCFCHNVSKALLSIWLSTDSLKESFIQQSATSLTSETLPPPSFEVVAAATPQPASTLTAAQSSLSVSVGQFDSERRNAALGAN